MEARSPPPKTDTPKPLPSLRACRGLTHSLAPLGSGQTKVSWKCTHTLQLGSPRCPRKKQNTGSKKAKGFLSSDTGDAQKPPGHLPGAHLHNSHRCEKQNKTKHANRQKPKAKARGR